VEGKLWLKVLIGMILGTITGIFLGPTANIINPEVALIIGEWLALPGTIFLRVIQMIVIPLIFASIIKGIASGESMKQLRKTGISVGVYFIFTTTVAILIGISLAFWIQPGKYIGVGAIQGPLEQSGLTTEIIEFSGITIQEVPSLIGTLLPSNLFGSLINGEMLQIVIFTIIFGIALVNLNVKQSKPILELLGSLQNVCMTIVKWAMFLAPFAVFGLMARLTIQFGFDTLIGIGAYAATVILGFLILLMFYSMIVFFSIKRNPFKFMAVIKDVQLLAFSTSSSVAVMPLSMKTAEEKLGVRPFISQFVVPIGATVNMDGTALYQGIATVFLAQVFGINLSLTALLLLIVTIVGASIGTPATPGVGIVILATVLTSLGIPLAGLALILGLDRILDMIRTALNVTGDLTACVVINKIVSGKKTTKQLLKEEALREKRRKTLKQDVIISKVASN
jgi:Na+/H+-dicarboxylate symporter